MSDAPKITWWKYEQSIFLKAWHGTSRASFVRGIVVGVLALLGQHFAGLRNSYDTLLMVLISLGAGVLVFLVEFVFKLFGAPVKMANEAQEKFTDEKKRLETIIESLHKPSAPTLGIEIIHPAVNGG